MFFFSVGLTIIIIILCNNHKYLGNGWAKKSGNLQVTAYTYFTATPRIVVEHYGLCRWWGKRIHFAWAHNYKNSWKLLLLVICFYTLFACFFEGVVRIPKLLRLPFVDVSLLQRERRLPWEYLCEFLVVLWLIDFTLNKNSFWNYNLYCFSNTLNISLSHDLFTFTCRTAEKQIQWTKIFVYVRYPQLSTAMLTAHLPQFA